jgi:hypothetical protein
MLAYAANLVLGAWRWQLILRPIGSFPFPIMMRALVQ